MEEIRVKSWEECQRELRRIEDYRSEVLNNTSTYISHLLYRGHANHRWHLATTLERFAPDDLRVESYYTKVSVTKPQIETLTDKVWEIPSIKDFLSWSASADIFMKQILPGYEFMVHLRHNGFPSPLLDWTRSQFVAAYFAFQNIPPETDCVSLYAYLELVGQGKTHEVGKPLISSLGPYIRTHKRHWLQQSEYTFCTAKKGPDLCYACHEDVFAEVSEPQDILWKIDIPASESLTALHQLDKMNINAFSLFASEESLMATVAIREFHLRKAFP